MKIEDALRLVADAAAGAGMAKPYLVGGALRDMIMGRQPKDYDITCGSADSLKLAVAVGRMYGAPIYRMKSGSIKVMLGGHELDFSPCVIYGNLPESLESEARSRDFTINSVMMDITSGQIVDMLGGVADILNRKLRPCDADLFYHDPVRAYRAIKYIADGFAPDENVLKFVRGSVSQHNRHAKSLLNEALRRNPDIVDFLIENGILRQVPMTKLLITTLKDRRQLHLC